MNKVQIHYIINQCYNPKYYKQYYLINLYNNMLKNR